ncbi:MAG: hypothetical protein EA397_11585 [Deltaproteobacteria bacterium]|nr:MAG: hypothetical protein EA397_11585 [Deltaproteobacteria bacterium]
MTTEAMVKFAERNVAYSSDERIVERSVLINGIPIRLWKTVYFVHDVYLPSGSEVHFDAVPRRWYHLLLQLFGRGRPLGIPALDAKAVISMSNADSSRAFFERSGRASLIAQIVASGGKVQWHDDHVVIEVPSTAFPDDGLTAVTLLLDTVLPAPPLPDSDSDDLPPS